MAIDTSPQSTQVEDDPQNKALILMAFGFAIVGVVVVSLLVVALDFKNRNELHHEPKQFSARELFEGTQPKPDLTSETIEEAVHQIGLVVGNVRWLATTLSTKPEPPQGALRPPERGLTLRSNELYNE